MELKVIRGDITKQKVDAIVNAANTSLLGGGGVDGAIHLAAGTALLDECRKLGGCYTGDAKVTSGFRLPAKFIIHTVGPIWKGGKNEEEELLQSCYRKSLMLAEKMELKSIAFPNISTGIYGYPKDKAADVAITEVKNTIPDLKFVKEITFVCFDEENYDLYRKKITKV